MKRKLRNFVIFISIVFTLSSCDILEGLGGENLNDLTTEEVVAGLKKALEIGTDSSSTTLSQPDGYYMNAELKILLPPEADIISSNLAELEAYDPNGLLVPLIEDELEKLVLSINRSAEDAAKDAAPIFSNAITSLSITDGWDILNGIVPSETTKSEVGFDSLAATKYLKSKTYNDLFELYSTPMNASLSKDFVGNLSAKELWVNITSNYNEIIGYANLAEFYTGKHYDSINTDIGEFVTGKALNGLFNKVGEEEKKIRTNPYEWADQLIQEVFGSVLN